MQREDGVGVDMINNVRAKPHARRVDPLHVEMVRLLGPLAPGREEKAGAAILERQRRRRGTGVDLQYRIAATGTGGIAREGQGHFNSLWRTKNCRPVASEPSRRPGQLHVGRSEAG